MEHQFPANYSPHPFDDKMFGDIRRAIESDPVIGRAIRALLFPDEPTTANVPKGPPPPCPLVPDITAVQVAIFDNWPGGFRAKNHPNRYGCAVEVWTKAAENIRVTGKPNFDFKSSCALMDRKNLQRHLKVLRKPRNTPISTEYLDGLGIIAENMADDMRIGLINTVIDNDREAYARGGFYHSQQFVIAYLGANGEPDSMRLCIEGTALDVAAFDNRDAGGKPHGANVILQSRTDCSGFSNTWSTSERNA